MGVNLFRYTSRYSSSAIMIKGKEYDWKDSNMALFGSDTEKKVKKEAADTEPAWQNAGLESIRRRTNMVQQHIKRWNWTHILGTHPYNIEKFRGTKVFSSRVISNPSPC